jgi:hypothetical protein
VRDDRVARIDRLHEVRDHPVRGDRHLVRGELGRPLLQPGLPGLLDFRRHAAVARAAAQEVLGRVDELAKDLLGIAQDRMIGSVVLVEIALVVGGVNDDLARRDVGRHPVLGEAAADPEHEIRLRQEVMRRPGHDAPAAGAERERMILREGALALERGHDRNLQKLGELEELGAALGVHHALPGVNHRLLRLEQRPRGRFDVARVARGARGLHRLVLERDLLRDVGNRHVGRDLDHDRAGASHLQEIERAPHDLAELLGLVQGLDPLRDRRVGARRAEERKHLGPIALVAERQDQDRDRVGERRGDAGKRVLGTGAVLHREDAETPPVGGPAEAVGDADADALLAAEHGPDPSGRRGIDYRRRRVRAEEFDAFALHDLGDRVDHFHFLSPLGEGAPPPSRLPCERGGACAPVVTLDRG